MDNQSTSEIATKNSAKVTGSTLKIIAIVTMLIDHTAAVLLGNNMIMRMIGRIAFPIFIFLLVEGAIHTRNKIKYALRLSLFALISEIPFDLAFSNEPFFFGYQNVFFTLAIGMFMIIAFDLVEKQKIPNVLSKLFFAIGIFAPAGSALFLFADSFASLKRNYEFLSGLSHTKMYIILFVLVLLLTCIYLYIVSSRLGNESLFASGSNLLFLCLAVIIAVLLKTDYSAMGILAIATMYRLRSKKTESFLFGCLVLILFQPFEIPALLGLLPVSRYNGKRGLKSKYFFYIFYPAHLLLLYGISMLILR